MGCSGPDRKRYAVTAEGVTDVETWVANPPAGRGSSSATSEACGGQRPEDRASSKGRQSAIEASLEAASSLHLRSTNPLPSGQLLEVSITSSKAAAADLHS